VGQEQVVAIREERVILTMAKSDLPAKVRGLLGEAGLIDAIYQPIYEVLLDYKPHTIGEIEASVASKNVTFAQLASALRSCWASV